MPISDRGLQVFLLSQEAFSSHGWVTGSHLRRGLGFKREEKIPFHNYSFLLICWCLFCRCNEFRIFFRAQRNSVCFFLLEFGKGIFCFERRYAQSPFPLIKNNYKTKEEITCSSSDVLNQLMICSL